MTLYLSKHINIPNIVFPFSFAINCDFAHNQTTNFLSESLAFHNCVDVVLQLEITVDNASFFRDSHCRVKIIACYHTNSYTSRFACFDCFCYADS